MEIYKWFDPAIRIYRGLIVCPIQRVQWFELSEHDRDTSMAAWEQMLRERL